MFWGSALAIYFLFWFAALFMVLPMGVRTHADIGGTHEPGHAESAPVNFSARKIVWRTTLLSGALFGLYYANYVNGWVTIDMIDMTTWAK